MGKTSKIILDIIPLTRIPLSRNQSFSYLADRKLEAGTLVSVPLFKRNIQGIVLGSRPDFPRLGNIELKKIASVLEENFLTEEQLELAKFISNYYFCPLGIVLKFFVPKRVKARNLQPTTYNPQPTTQDRVILTNEQQKAVDEITKKAKSYKLKATSYYLHGPSGSGKTEVYIHSILKFRANNSQFQFLILLPEIMLTPQAMERYGAHFAPEEMTLMHSKIPKGKFYSNWQKIKSGKAKIIIGSRMAVFAPFKNLKLIIIDEEQDISFKQWDMSPRYDARKAAEKLAEIHGAKIVFGSATPSVELFHRAGKDELKLLNLPRLNLQPTTYNPQPNMELVDMRKERWQKNYSPISKKLQSEITYILKNKLQAILFVNRQGMSNFSICADCRTTLKCPKCDRALVYGADGRYQCLHCSHKTSITPQCSKCKGLKFQNIGLGTQKVEREIVNMFPAARIARADSQAMKDPKFYVEVYEKFSQGRADILIGTQMISKGWDLPTVALIGIIDADNLLSPPDLDSNVRAYQHIVQVSGRAGRPGSKFPGKVVIQTYDPENPVIKATAERDFSLLYEMEMKERKALYLPPFGKIIKLIFQNTDADKVKSETNRIFDELKRKKEKRALIYEPQSSVLPNVRGRFRRQIMIKLANSKSPIPPKIRKILNSLPSGWIIDVDPISTN